MNSYLKLLERCLEHGIRRENRTGVPTLSVFGGQVEFFLEEGFPLVTTKDVHFKSVVEELLWFLSGSTNVKDLQARGVTIWDEWARADGELGPTYGRQWRKFGKQGMDQIVRLVEDLVEDPFSRRHIVTAWNPHDALIAELPPCHCFFQCYVDELGGLSLHLYQRSADVFLGVPFNIASYAALVHMLAAQTGYTPHKLIISYGDLHLYENHAEVAWKQLSRKPRDLPKLELSAKTSLFDYTFDDFILTKYNPHPKLKAKVAV